MNSTKNPQSTVTVKEWQREFIRFAIEKNVLQFGEFTLKSGRQSPYFFNAGKFDDGESQRRLGQVYAQALVDSGLSFDLVFGPAYKGIPLATSTVTALHGEHGRNVKFAFDRKEAKDHGEGGKIVGAELKGDIVLVDDVITAGTAIRGTIDMLKQFPEARLVAAVVLIDRQEKLVGAEMSAIQSLEQEHGLKVLPAMRLDQIMATIAEDPQFEPHLNAMRAYQGEFGVS